MVWTGSWLAPVCLSVIQPARLDAAPVQVCPPHTLRHLPLTSHDSVKRVRRISQQVTAGTGVFLPLPSEPELRWSSERRRLSEQQQGCQSPQSHSLRERQAQHQLKYTAHINGEGQHTVLTWTTKVYYSNRVKLKTPM